MSRLGLVACLVFGACRSPAPPGLAEWQAAFFEHAPSAEWGFRQGPDYFRMGEAVALQGEPLAQLRTLLSTKAGEGPFKCIVHIDGRLTAGKVTADVCTGCGVFVIDHTEWAIGDKTTLRKLLVSSLGERPNEPGTPPEY